MKIKILSCVLVLMAMIGCEVIEEILTFNIRHQSTFRIDSVLPIDSTVDIPLPEITTNAVQSFENNHTREDRVKDIRLQELKIRILDPEDETFRFLKSIRIYISTDQLGETELAYLDNIDTDADEITLIPLPKKLDDYIKAPAYRLRTEIVTRGVPKTPIELQADMKFRVTADPL